MTKSKKPFTPKVKWSKKDIKTLKSLVRQGYTAKSIGEQLNRTPLAVATRKHVLGFKSKKGTRRTSTPVVSTPTVSIRNQVTTPRPARQGSQLNISGGTFTQEKLNAVLQTARANNATVNITFN